MDRPTLAASEDATGWQLSLQKLREVFKVGNGLEVRGIEGEREWFRV